MKKLIYLMSFALLTTVACKKEDKDDNNTQQPNDTNTATFNGSTFSTPNGFVEDFGPNDSISHDWDVSFATLTAAQFNSENLNATGENIIYLDLNGSFGSTSLEAGTYNYVSESVGRTAFSLVYASAHLNANIVDGFPAGVGEGGIATESLSGGSVTVEKSGDNYTITYALEFSGINVSGNFSGTLESLDQSGFSVIDSPKRTIAIK